MRQQSQSTHGSQMLHRCIRILLPVAFAFCSVFGLGCFDSCVPPFPPGYHIDKFRVLAIKAEPPEIGPGDRTQMSFLAVDTNGLIVTGKVFPPSQCFSSTGIADPSALWVACLPGVGVKQQSQQNCSDFSALGLGGGDAGPPTPADGGAQSFQILLPPCGPTPTWSAPKDYLAPLSPEDQLKGANAIIVLATLQNELRQISLKNVKISTKPEAERNTNPILTKILIDGKEVSTCRADKPEDCKAMVVPFNKKFAIKAEIDPTRQDALPPGKDQKPRKEDITIEWYSTAGEFSTRRNVISGETPPRDSPIPDWSPSDYIGKPLAQGLEVQIVAIAVDSRGGFDWISCRILLGAP